MSKYVLRYQCYDNGHYESITATSDSKTEIEYRAEKLKQEFEEKTGHCFGKFTHLQGVWDAIIDSNHLASLIIIETNG